MCESDAPKSQEELWKELQQELGSRGEILVVPSETATNGDFADALFQFQYGEGEESDRGFEEMRRIQREQAGGDER